MRHMLEKQRSIPERRDRNLSLYELTNAAYPSARSKKQHGEVERETPDL